MIQIDRSKVEVPHTVRFWGQDRQCDPRFVEQALGDGEQLIGIQPLNTRPHYYVIRVDSSWHMERCRKCQHECPDDIREHLYEIYQAIEDEYREKESVRYENENELEEGEQPESDDWPVLDLDCGASWFPIDPEEYPESGPAQKMERVS